MRSSECMIELITSCVCIHHHHTYTHTHTHSHTLTQTQAHTGGGKNTVDVLKLLQSYINETSFTIWDSITDTLSTINLLLGNTNFHPAFQPCALSLLRPVMSRLGWKPRETDCEYTPLPQSFVSFLYSCP